MRLRIDLAAMPDGTIADTSLQLQDLASGRWYTEATVRMTFTEPDVCAVRLSQQSPGSDAEIGTWGVGRPELSWKLRARDEQSGLRPGSRTLLAVVESPLGSARLAGTLDASARFARRMLGMTSQAVAEPRRPLRFVLNVADGDFELVAGQ